MEQQLVEGIRQIVREELEADRQRMAELIGEPVLLEWVGHEMDFKRFDQNLPALYKEDEDNAGYDLFARLDAPITIQPGDSVRIPLNVATDIPPGVVGLLFQRSSTHSKWKVRLTNGVGVIDRSYSGDEDEWQAEFQNTSHKPTVINNGDKVCQAVFFNYINFQKLNEVLKFDKANRGGFGTSFDNANQIR